MLKYNFTLLFAFLIIISCSSDISGTEIGNGAISGVALSKDSTPISNLKVKIYTKAKRPILIDSTLTNIEGKYYFNDVTKDSFYTWAQNDTLGHYSSRSIIRDAHLNEDSLFLEKLGKVSLQNLDSNLILQGTVFIENTPFELDSFNQNRGERIFNQIPPLNSMYINIQIDSKIHRISEVFDVAPSITTFVKPIVSIITYDFNAQQKHFASGQFSNLWLANENQVFLYQNGIFIEVFSVFGNTENDTITTIYSDSLTWLGTQSGEIITISGQKIQNRIPGPAFTGPLLSLFPYQNRIWALTDQKGVLNYKDGSWTITDQKKDPILDDRFTKILNHPIIPGVLLSKNSGEIIQIDSNLYASEFLPSALPNDTLKDWIIGENMNFWLLFNQSIKVYDYQKKPIDINLSNIKVSEIQHLISNYHGVWLASSNKLYYVKNQRSIEITSLDLAENEKIINIVPSINSCIWTIGDIKAYQVCID